MEQLAEAGKDNAAAADADSVKKAPY